MAHARLLSRFVAYFGAFVVVLSCPLVARPAEGENEQEPERNQRRKNKDKSVSELQIEEERLVASIADWERKRLTYEKLASKLDSCALDVEQAAAPTGDDLLESVLEALGYLEEWPAEGGARSESSTAPRTIQIQGYIINGLENACYDHYARALSRCDWESYGRHYGGYGYRGSGPYAAEQPSIDTLVYQEQVTELHDDLSRAFETAEKCLNDSLKAQLQDDEVLTIDDATDLVRQFNGQTCTTSLNSGLKGAIKARRDGLDVKMESASGNMKAAEQSLAGVRTELRKREKAKVSIDKMVIYILPFLGLTVILVLLVPWFYKEEGLQRQIFSSGLVLELLTVYLLTSAILILGISTKLDSQVLGTLLGGIAGYVLGRSTSLPAQRQSRPRTGGSDDQAPVDNVGTLPTPSRSRSRATEDEGVAQPPTDHGSTDAEAGDQSPIPR